jgi:hypothetical protein
MNVYQVDNIEWDLIGVDNRAELDLPTDERLSAYDEEDVAQKLFDKYGVTPLSIDTYLERAFCVGQRVRVGDCAGVMSNCEAVVIDRVPYRQVLGMYQEPDRYLEACLKRVSDGMIFYIFTSMLKHLD